MGKYDNEKFVYSVIEPHLHMTTGEGARKIVNGILELMRHNADDDELNDRNTARDVILKIYNQVDWKDVVNSR